MFNYYNPCGLFHNCYINQNTSGDSKVTVFKRIRQVILPELFALDGTTVANQLKGQLERYVPTLDFTMEDEWCYTEHVNKAVVICRIFCKIPDKCIFPSLGTVGCPFG